ncbi:MAG: hypothetical protein HKN74_10050 [Acidimicrobiia bacterium]|nr:hypothetical protein [Acidimicrobiia bacterium]NNF10614.1 hypothetical protein [Acidimicrobiia bacterium]NNL69770.1 hypothetical protein [Acidimicrobiia bacterium]
MTENDRREELAEARAALRQTWPSLTADDIDNLPRSRDEAADLLQKRTGATIEEVQTALSEVYGLVPERHEPIEE